MLLKNATAYINGEFIKTDVLIKGESIIKIAPNLKAGNDEVIDLNFALLSAGFIDVHQHLREPGFSEKETIASGTLAASAGGICTVCAMPNLKPVPDSLENLQIELDLIKQNACVKVLPYASITKAQKSKELVDFKALAPYVFAFSDDGVGVEDAAMMKEAFKAAKACDKFIISHCEERSLVQNGHMHDGKQAKKLGIAGICSSSESVQVARDGLLALETGAKFHVCHISSKESVEIVRMLKRLGAKISAEVTPHHLISCDEDILNDDGMYKMNPPLRSKADQLSLIAGLNDGTIDIIATDHAPHTKEQKACSFKDAYFGIIGSEFAFSLLYSKLVLPGLVSLERILDAFCHRPKHLFNLSNSGELKVGSKADLCAIDLDKVWRLDESKILSKGKNTPYLGEQLRSKVILTIVDGKIIYKEI